MHGHASATEAKPLSVLPERLQGVVSNTIARAQAALAEV